MWNWALEIWRMSKAIRRWLSRAGKLDKTSSPMDFHRIKEECKVHFTHRSFICQIWEISILRECLLYHHTRFLIRLIWKYLPNSAAETYPIYLISNLVLSVLGLVVCFLFKQWPVNWPIQQAIFVVRTALEMLDMSKAIGDSVADSVSLINQSTNHHFTTWAAQYQANPWYPLDHWCWNCWIVWS